MISGQPTPDKPHFLQRQPRGPLEPASTAEITPLVAAHSWHDGIAFFPECQECQTAKAEGRYPHWFPAQQN